MIWIERFSKLRFRITPFPNIDPSVGIERRSTLTTNRNLRFARNFDILTDPESYFSWMCPAQILYQSGIRNDSPKIEKGAQAPIGTAIWEFRPIGKSGKFRKQTLSRLSLSRAEHISLYNSVESVNGSLDKFRERLIP
jgi:hypothetical protein